MLLLVLSVGCDQVSKKIVRTQISYGEHINVIQDRFTLTKVENRGAFLSVGDNLPSNLRVLILTGLPVIFLGFGLYFLFAKENLPKRMQVALCCLIGGGIGNLYDRLVHGSVTDFMHMDFGLFQTGVFNVADILIMIGVGILLFQSFTAKLREKTTNN